MRRSSDFTTTVRRGRRVRRGALVVHQLRDAAPGDVARVGFVVSRAVGPSTTRHRVVRRLRALVRARLGELPPGSTTVVRALPEAADANSRGLDAELAAALSALGRSVPAGAAR